MCHDVDTGRGSLPCIGVAHREPDGEQQQGRDVTMQMTDSDVPYDRHPAFETVPSATDIAHWFVENKRGVGNVSGDAWWLSRDPHGSARMLAFVDYDVQEFWLLDIATGDSRDLLFVTNGLDGTWCEWWQHPRSTFGGDPYWYRDGIAWMADQIIVHGEQVANQDGD